MFSMTNELLANQNMHNVMWRILDIWVFSKKINIKTTKNYLNIIWKVVMSPIFRRYNVQSILNHN